MAAPDRLGFDTRPKVIGGERPRVRMVVFRIVLALAMYGALEATAWLSLEALRRLRGIVYEPIVLDSVSTAHREILGRVIAGTTKYYGYSRELGWTIRPNGASPLYRANAQGLRADADVNEDPAGTLRLAAFGDSFTHGSDVPNAAAWPARLAQTLGVPVLNFGVGGYGLDQAYLRYLIEGRRYRPAVVLIGLMSGDPFRHVSVYRPFYSSHTGMPLAKPRFVLDGDALVLVANPAQSVDDYRQLLADPRPTLERFARLDWYAQRRFAASAWDVSPTLRFGKVVWQKLVRERSAELRKQGYPEGGEIYRLTVALLERFVRDVEADGARALILLLPGGGDLKRFRRGSSPMYEPIRRHLDARGFAFLDVMTAFEPCEGVCDVRSLIPTHYSELGNRLVAEHVAARVRELGWLNR